MLPKQILTKTLRNLSSYYQRRPVHTKRSPNAKLDKNISDRYMCLPSPECKVQVSYVWIDGTGANLRSKTKVLNFAPGTYKECPNWSFDGSGTFFTSVEHSDCYMVPIAMYPDPFRRGNNRIVLCETFTSDKKPTKTNKRQGCVEILNKACDHEAEFGFEQEFYYAGYDGRPFGWGTGGAAMREGYNYGGVGANAAVCREITECVYRCCFYCGIDLCGSIPEDVFGKWRIFTGPTGNIKAADDLWMLRYLLHRVSEDFGVSVSIKPKLFASFPGCGLLANMSTKKSRCDDGIKVLQEYIKKMEKKHAESLCWYDVNGGSDVKRLLDGTHKTSNANSFVSGVGNRRASVRITPHVADKKKGHFEDRRPAANADPYMVMTSLIQTCLL